jgi:hypothetical protein
MPVFVREMLPEEQAMVCSDWKKDLRDEGPAWGKALHGDEWWALVNFVINRVTVPTSVVLMVCHTNEPSVPLAWLATRDRLILHTYARVSVREDPELAAFLERTLREHSGAHTDALDFNPFLELKRCP